MGHKSACFKRTVSSLHLVDKCGLLIGYVSLCQWKAFLVSIYTGNKKPIRNRASSYTNVSSSQRCVIRQSEACQQPDQTARIFVTASQVSENIASTTHLLVWPG